MAGCRWFVPIALVALWTSAHLFGQQPIEPAVPPLLPPAIPPGALEPVPFGPPIGPLAPRPPIGLPQPRVLPPPIQANPPILGAPARGGNGAPEAIAAGRAEVPLKLVEFRELPLIEAMRLFSEQTGMNIVPSAEASKVVVSLYLRDVRPSAALDAMVKAYGLYIHRESDSSILRIYTTKEYQRDIRSFRDEQTQVFTLLYPNPVQVAMALQSVFGDRVMMNLNANDFIDLQDLYQRFNRFDLVDGRSLGLGTYQGNGNFGNVGGVGVGGFGGGVGGGGYGGLGGGGLGGFGGGGLGGFGGGGLGGFGGGFGGFGGGYGGYGGFNQNALGRNQQNTSPEQQRLTDLTPDEIQALEEAREGSTSTNEQVLADFMRRRSATIYVSVIRRNNQVIVRTGDSASMRQIEELICRLDVPTPLVLLEVKVMTVNLEDGFRSTFDYQFSDGSGVAGGFTTGNILPPASDALADPARYFASIAPGGSVLNQGDLTFQYVNSSFRYRMQLLENKNRITVVSSPLLLTANNEVSRIFIGETLPFTIGFTAPAIVTGGVNTNTVGSAPITELRDVGQSLLITPNINADRTVTLRIVQENSRKVTNGANIPVQQGDGQIENLPVDTVARSTVSGTIVGKDGLAVVVGGLIEEGVDDLREEVPVVGKIPVLGFFFRRQETGRHRRETIIMIRPYVFNTPQESAHLSKNLVEELSVHPNAYDGRGTLGTYAPYEVSRPDPPADDLHDVIWRFHSVQPKIQ